MALCHRVNFLSNPGINKNGFDKAKIIFFTVDGDSVNHPRRWMRMEKCDPDTFSFPEDTEAEGDTESEE